VPDFVQHAGRGVQGVVDESVVLVGTARMMKEAEIEVGPTAVDALERLAEEGKTGLLVAVDSRVVGIFGVADTLRPEAASAVAALRSSGVDELVMLTGDSPQVARRIG